MSPFKDIRAAWLRSGQRSTGTSTVGPDKPPSRALEMSQNPCECLNESGQNRLPTVCSCAVQEQRQTASKAALNAGEQRSSPSPGDGGSCFAQTNLVQVLNANPSAPLLSQVFVVLCDSLGFNYTLFLLLWLSSLHACMIIIIITIM